MMKHLQLRITANWECFYYGLSQIAIDAVMQTKIRLKLLC